jgi:DNA primase
MPGRIPENFIQDLLARTDIVELIDSRVQLKKTGRNYSACCPFHNEKTPSFTVAPDKQFYYCFGCGATGNAVGFLMEYDHLNFPEAIEQLASRAGMEVPREKVDIEKARQRDRLQPLYELLERAERFYRQQLKSAPERDRAVNYLKGRGLTGDIAARFGMGFAPPGFDNLITGLSLDEQSLEQAVTVGLLVRREDTDRVYDKFRDRIMFPIRDGRGRTLGFGGRVLGDGKPKYLNSPETPVFHKGRELYGLWEWRQTREKHNRLFVVEGYMDVIALHQHGIPNVVATLGTATTEDHARLLFRHVDEVVFCFDGDNAGRRAAWRALESTMAELDDGKQARFLFLPEGEDPDTLVREQGGEGLLAAAEEAPGLVRFLFQHLSEDLDTGTVEGRARLARLALPWLEKPRGEVYQSLLRKELAQLTQLGEDEIRQMLAKRQSQAQPRTPQAAPSMPEPDGPPPPDVGMEPASPMDEDWTPPLGRRQPERQSRVRQLADRLIILMMQQPELLHRHPLPEGIEELDDPRLDLMIQVAQLVREHPDATPASLMGTLMAALEESEELSRLMRGTLSTADSPETLERVWRDALKQLEIQHLETAINAEERSQSPDPHRIAELSRALHAARGQLASPLQ